MVTQAHLGFLSYPLAPGDRASEGVSEPWDTAMNVRKELLPLTQAIHPPFLSPPGSPTRWSWAVGRAGMAAGLRGVSCVHWRQVCPTSENLPSLPQSVCHNVTFCLCLSFHLSAWSQQCQGPNPQVLAQWGILQVT